MRSSVLRGAINPHYLHPILSFIVRLAVLKISHQPRTLSSNQTQILGDDEVVVEDHHNVRLRKKH
jgi:hypothetical protein